LDEVSAISKGVGVQSLVGATGSDSMGANILVVSKMLGHNDPSVTLNYYGHMYQADQMQLAEDINARYIALPVS
jgi:integrase